MTPTDTPVDRLKKLRELREAASPGEWKAYEANINMQEGDVVIGDGETLFYFAMNNGGENCSHDPLVEFPHHANARLAAQTPALAASVEALGAALLRHACDSDCFIDGDEDPILDRKRPICGREQALATIPDLVEEE